jgi:hypothetical protein
VIGPQPSGVYDMTQHLHHGQNHHIPSLACRQLRWAMSGKPAHAGQDCAYSAFKRVRIFPFAGANNLMGHHVTGRQMGGELSL